MLSLTLLVTALALAADPEGAPPTRLGPARIDVPTGHVRLGLTVQLEAEAAIDDAVDASVRVRRLRPDLSAVLLDGRLGLRAHFNLGPGAGELMDTTLDWRLEGGERITLGQQRIPLTRYRQQAFRELVLVDWSGLTQALGSERQLGLFATNRFAERVWTWDLALTTGVNARAPFERGLADAYAEARPNRSALSGGVAATPIHPEVVIRVGGRTRGEEPTRQSDTVGGAARVAASVGAALDLAPDPVRDHAMRLAPELLVQGGGASAMLVGHAGWADVDGVPTLAQVGGMAELSRRFGRLEPALRYALLQTTPALREAARARADAIVADDPAKADQYAAAGAVVRTHEALVGLTWWAAEADLRVAGDAGWVATTTDSTASGARIRATVQVGF